MKKILLIFAMLIIFSGCGNKELNKIHINKDDIKGYMLNLRIYGIHEGKKINESLIITNYENKEYEIVKPSEKKGYEERNKKKIYVKSKKTYEINEDGIYIESNSCYKNPAIYLESLDNISKVEIKEEKIINNNKYTYYKVLFKSTFVNQILSDTIIDNKKIDTDVKGEIYIDKDNNIYRIIFEMDTITINVKYYSINSVNPISFPVLYDKDSDEKVY